MGWVCETGAGIGLVYGVVERLREIQREMEVSLQSLRRVSLAPRCRSLFFSVFLSLHPPCLSSGGRLPYFFIFHFRFFALHSLRLIFLLSFFCLVSRIESGEIGL